MVNVSASCDTINANVSVYLSNQGQELERYDFVCKPRHIELIVIL